MSLRSILDALDGLPNVVDTDLGSAAQFIDELKEIFGSVRGDVYVDRAVLELQNQAGYPVGSLVFDSELDLYKFVPHRDNNPETEDD